MFLNGVNLFSTGVSAYLVDRLGRRPLLYFGLGVMVVALVGLSCVLYADNNAALTEGTQGAIAVVCVMIYMFGFAIGMGSVVWVMLSELSPNQEVRSKLMSAFLNVNWACNILLGMTTLEFIRALGNVPAEIDDDTLGLNNRDLVLEREKKGVALLYFVFLGMTIVCILFVRYCVPDMTRNHGILSTCATMERDSSDLLKNLIVPVMNKGYGEDDDE
jgi:MFS family permease